MEIQSNPANGKPPSPTSTYDLGDCILYAEFGELHSKINKQHIHIEKKVCEVFACLAKKPGEVVKRQLIFDQVWPNMTVSDDSLNRCISVLRKTFREFDHGLSIQTHPKVGFHLEVTSQNKPVSANGHDETATEVDNAEPYYTKDVNLFPAVIVTLLLTVTSILLVSYLITIKNDTPASVTSLNPQRVVVQAFNAEPRLKARYTELYDMLVDRFANHPYHTSVDLNLVDISGLNTPEKLANHLSARFVITGNITENKDRHILAWRLTDANSGDILLSKSLNIKLADSTVNTNLIITEAVAEIGKLAFDGDLEKHVKYIVDSANYLFNPRGNWHSHQPLLTLVAKAIVDIDPDSPIALKALSEFLINTMWPLQYPNAPYANLAKQVLEKAINISPKDIELYQLLAKAYLLQYRWSDAASIVSLALIEFPANSPEIAKLSAMIELNALQVTPKLIAFLEDNYQQQPLSSDYSLTLAKAYLLANRKIDALKLANDIVMQQQDLGAFSLPLGHLIWQYRKSEQGYRLIIEGLNYLVLDKERYFLNVEDASQFNFTTTLNQAELLKNTMNANHLNLFAATADIDKFYSLAMKLADSKQFNPETFITPNARLLMEDSRFKQLMDKIGLTNYWQSSSFPDFCRQIPSLNC